MSDNKIAANIDSNTESKDIIEAYQEFEPPKEDNDENQTQDDTAADV